MNHSAAKIGLLVDDDTLYLRTLQRSLGRRGVDTVTATDAVSALTAARSASKFRLARPKARPRFGVSAHPRTTRHPQRYANPARHRLRQHCHCGRSH